MEVQLTGAQAGPDLEGAHRQSKTSGAPVGGVHQGVGAPGEIGQAELTG